MNGPRLPPCPLKPTRRGLPLILSSDEREFLRLRAHRASWWEYVAPMARARFENERLTLLARQWGDPVL